MMLARGDILLDKSDAILMSPLAGISSRAWTSFVRKMATARLSAVSPSNALGMFELTPRRLADFGLVTSVQRMRSPAGKTIWVAVFLKPMTSDKFLRSPGVQYSAFLKSMTDYARRIQIGEIEKPPLMSLAGALAILHRAGPKGIVNWRNGSRFSRTQAAFDRVAGVF